MRWSSCREAAVSPSARAMPPQRSVCNNTRGRTLLASRMTQASAPGRHSLNFRRGGFRTVGKIASEDECKRYIGAFKDGIPTACRQLAMPNSCNVACVAPVQPPAIPPKPPEVSPDPASLRDEVTPPGLAGINTNIQVGGKQYTKMAGLTWVEKESTKPDSFADVSVGPND